MPFCATKSWQCSGLGSIQYVQLLQRQRWQKPLLVKYMSGYERFVPLLCSKHPSFLVGLVWLCKRTNHSSITSRRCWNVHVYKLRFENCIIVTAPLWTKTSAGCVGLWNSWYFTHTSPGIHAIGPDKRCSNTAPNYSASCSSRDSSPLRRVACIQAGCKSSISNYSLYSKPLSLIRQLGYIPSMWNRTGTVWRWSWSTGEGVISINYPGTLTNSCGGKGMVKQEKRHLKLFCKILHNNIHLKYWPSIKI